MSKIINRALFYKEWINVRWVTLLTIIMLLFFKGYGVMSALNQNKMFIKYNSGKLNDRWFHNGLLGPKSYFFIMIFIVIVLAIILFIGEKTSETQGFIASMPFTRKEIILAKWIVGTLSILISFAVTYIFLSLFYVANINGLDTALNPYSDIVRWFFMDTFQYICIFTFIMLVQAVMGNAIVSGIVGGMLLIVPYFIASVLQTVIERFYTHTQYIFTFFYKICNWVTSYTYILTHPDWVNVETNTTIQNNTYRLELLTFFILTCLFLYLTYISYKKRNLEYNLRLIVFKNLEVVFIGGVAVCLGFLAGYAFSGESLSSFGICFVAFTVIGYFISKLSLKVLSLRK